MDEIFVVDVHKINWSTLKILSRLFTEEKQQARAKNSRYQAQTKPVRVDNWKETQPEEALATL